MADNASDYLEDALGDHVFNKVSLTTPNTWVALYTVAPTDTGGGTEVTQGGAYARIKVNPNGSSAPTWNLASAGVVDNNGAITWTTASDNWGTVAALGVLDASTAGNLLVYGNLTASKSVSTGDVFTIPAGALDVTIT